MENEEKEYQRLLDEYVEKATELCAKVKEIRAYRNAHAGNEVLYGEITHDLVSLDRQVEGLWSY